MAKSLPPMDFPPLDDYDEGWGFLDGPILDPELIREAPFVAGGGALATVAYGLLTAKANVTQKDDKGVVIKTDDGKEYKATWFDKPWKNLLGAVVIGVGGSRLAWDHQKDVARGILGAMGGQIAIELVRQFTGKSKDGEPVMFKGRQENLFSGGALGEDYYLSEGEDEDDDYASAMAELASAEPEDRNLLSDVNVEESRTLLGLDETLVETRQPELAWLV